MRSAARPDRGEALSAHAVTQRALRDTLGLFATGVAVVTATASNGERIGATVSSFNSVSLDPPLILFSIARSARAFPTWEAVPYFAVNVLDEHQGAISTRFAKALSDKWRYVRSSVGAWGSPLLDDALACFECVRHAAHDGGDHLIIVGRILKFTSSGKSDVLPLVFYGSRYRRLHGERNSSLDAEQWIHGW
jgi:flavin reductase (DIM6/NTAB) family NADH-FMN oxidoreductase RutF